MKCGYPRRTNGIEELIPESQDGEHSNIATIGVALGFALMMILDIALG